MAMEKTDKKNDSIVKGVSDYNIHRKSFKIFLDDEKTPKIIITYKIDDTWKVNPRLIRETMRFWIYGGNKKGERFSGKTPLVFVRKDCLEDLDVLNIANLIRIKLQDAGTEKDIEKAYREVKQSINNSQGWKKPIVSNLKKSFGNDNDAYIKMPEYNFIVIKDTTFEDVSYKKHIEFIKKNHINISNEKNNKGEL